MSAPPVDLSDFVAGYLAEVDEHLRSGAAHLLAAEANAAKGTSSPKAVRELYRSLHTIKGLSAMVGVEPIVQLAHAMETVLRSADRSGGQLSTPAVEALLRGLTAIEQRTKSFAQRAPVAAAPSAVIEALAALEDAQDTARRQAPAAALPGEIADRLSASEKEQVAQALAAGRRLIRVDFVPSAERSAAGSTITTVRERLGTLGEIVKVVPLSRVIDAATPGGLAFALLVATEREAAELAAAAGLSVADVVTVASPPEPDDAHPEAPMSASPGEEFVDDPTERRGVVRVEVARLDDALEKLSALVVTRFRLTRAIATLAESGVDVRDLRQTVSEAERQLRDLRNSIMRARMISASEMLERVPLLVRGLGRTTGKPLRLELDTGNAELDKAVAERIFPAIVHLVRNAVDHAIEPPHERARLGKPAEGLLRVICFARSNNQVEVVVEDDGRGIDREALARRARRDVPETNEALLSLMALPGVSTRDEASVTSGRGMGMDIVKRTVSDELGGEIAVRTTPGRGTTFVLRIPLSITILDALSFRCGAQTFVVPVSTVDEIVGLDEARVVHGPSSGKGRAEMRLIERRGVAVPLISLEHVFRLAPGAARLKAAIVIRRNGQPFAFEVGQMLGQKEIVVRPLQDPLVRTVGVVGATDLGDGQPTLVLDLVALSGHLSRRRTDVRA